MAAMRKGPDDTKFNSPQSNDLSIPEDVIGHRRVRRDFSKRYSSYECAENAARNGKGSAPSPMFEMIGKQLNAHEHTKSRQFSQHIVD